MENIKILEDFKMSDDYKADGMFYKFHQKVYFGQFVIIGPTTVNIPEYKKFGKIVQIRVGAGVAETDVFLLRHCNGDLSSHENQFVYDVTKKGKLRFSELFKSYSTEDEDNQETEYTIIGKEEATGFKVYDMPKSKDILTFGIAVISEGNINRAK